MRNLNCGLDIHFSSIKESLFVKVECDCSWSGIIADLQELEPDGWDMIKKWWEEKMIEPITNRSPEEFIKEQTDSNLRAIFG